MKIATFSGPTQQTCSIWILLDCKQKIYQHPSQGLKITTKVSFDNTFERRKIFELEMYLYTLEMYFYTLKMYVYTVEMNFCTLEMYFYTLEM